MSVSKAGNPGTHWARHQSTRKSWCGPEPLMMIVVVPFTVDFRIVHIQGRGPTSPQQTASGSESQIDFNNMLVAVIDPDLNLPQTGTGWSKG